MMDDRRLTSRQKRCCWRAPSYLRWSLLAALVTLLCTSVVARGQHVEGELSFYPDDPVWEDPDQFDGPVPEPIDRSQYYDLLLHSLGHPSDYHGAALNVNTLGEVPNSSWYTNRHFRHPMSIEELKQGPNTVEGPSLESPLTVVAGKKEGAALGVQVEDARGDRYLLKFDPTDHPEMSTGAEVITTKLLHALGYNVPENYIVYFTRDQMVVGDSATYETVGGEERPLTSAFVDTLLAHTPVHAGGQYRALASRFVEGEPIGPFSYFGTRPDDPNDLFLHEARRELRGLRVFSAWTHHYDARMANTLDVAVTEDDRTFLRHYLIDFGSTLGSGATQPTHRWLGHEYILAGWPVLARTLTLGFGASAWIDVDDPPYPSVGRWTDQLFDPAEWKPKYPNPAFERMDADDAFWAAKQVMAFSDEELRAIVSTAQYSDPDADRYVADVLIARRDDIGDAFLDHGGGLDRFRVQGDSLVFDDLLTRFGLADARPRRTVSWHPFENATGRTGPPVAEAHLTAPHAALPDSDAAFLAAVVKTGDVGTTRVILRRKDGRYEVVGVERE